MKHLPLAFAAATLIAGTPARAQECRVESTAQNRDAWDDQRRKESAFQAEIDSMLALYGIDGDDALILAYPRPDGAIETLLIDVDVSHEQRRAIEQVAERHVLSLPDPMKGAFWNPDAPVVPFREYGEQCPGRLDNRNLVVDELAWIRGELSDRGTRPPPRAEIQVYADHRGVVRHAKLREGTGDEWLDKQLLKLGRRLRYTPARRNGTPVGVWNLQPIDF